MRLVIRFVRIGGGECFQIEGLAMSLGKAIIILPSVPILHDVVDSFICNGKKVGILVLLAILKGSIILPCLRIK